MVVFFGSKSKRLSCALCLLGLSYCTAKEWIGKKKGLNSKLRAFAGRIDYLESKIDDLSELLKSKKK